MAASRPPFTFTGIEMNLDLEFLKNLLIPLSSVAATFLFKTLGLGKAIDDMRHLRKDRQKREYEFVSKLANNYKSNDLSRYAEEIGYSAIISDLSLELDDKKALLSLKNAH
ncbi:hypothetical protein, partial [Azohydromonas lata]|uniref:hypothetical protein n=1 Tax=Azohydromonas lata TaxID=45677 RepID=UPI0012F4F154